MYYEIHGKGEPLVLIAGLSTDISEYATLIKGLSKTYKVLAFDNRGAGRTDMPNIPYSIDMMANDTACLMEKIGFGKANVLGISMGGRIAQVLALNHPKLVRSLILISTSAQSESKWYFYILSLFTNLPLLRSKYPQPRYAHIRQRRTMYNHDVTEKVNSLNIPVLILHGSRDRIIDYALAEKMHEAIKGSKIIKFNGGHSFFFYRFPLVVEAINKFLAKPEKQIDS